MGLENFLSEENILLHKEYANTLALKYSILEKSFDFIKNKDISQIYKMKIDKGIKAEILDLKTEILVHDLFFNSFSARNEESKCIKKIWGSEANFLYNLLDISDKKKQGFLIIYEKNEENRIYCGETFTDIFVHGKPKLALDLYEHAYFFDYKFDKKQYIRNALANLNLKVLDND